MRIFRIFAVLLLCIPAASFAVESTMLDSNQTVQQLIVLINQYDTRIKQLENENNVLRVAMQKANIQIPLVEYSGAIASPLPTALTWASPYLNPTVPANTWSISSSAPSTSSGVSSYAPEYAGFITRINKDWDAIRSAYALPANAHLAGYEFIQTGSYDHVFADVVYGTGTTWIYNAKILYQFEKKEFKRKLIGIFIYDIKTQKYATKVGNNPFGWVARKFIKDESFSGGTTTQVPSVTPITGVTPQNPTSPVSWEVQVSSSTVTVADITKAYNEKRYLTTISLSNTYLSKNPATHEILSIRYRTYFIIGKYAESLAELAKIEALGTMDRQTACNAQVIATYSKNTSLVTKYTNICTKK